MKQKMLRALTPLIFTCLVGIGFFFASSQCQAQGFTISTVAGCGSCFEPNLGDFGPATTAPLSQPAAIALDAAGNLYIVDTGSLRVRKVSAAGIITTVAGSDAGTTFTGDGGPAILAGLYNPSGVAVDGAGNVFIADTFNNRIRQVSSDGKINTVAGGGKGCAAQVDSLGDGCAATNATLFEPQSVTVDAAGNLYVADTYNHRIRKISTNGIIATVAGGTCCVLGDGGPATQAYFGNPTSVAVDSSGNMYICCGDSRVRKVSTDGIITTVAGNGTFGFKGDGGSALIAELSSPATFGVDTVVVDVAGNLYISDANRVRRVGLDGTINTIAGGGNGCSSQTDSVGDGCSAVNAQLNFPQGLAIDLVGNLYVADQGNKRIRLLNAGTAITLTANAFGETALIAPNTWVEIKGSHLAPAKDTRIWQGSDFTNNQLPTQLDGVSVTVNGKKAFVYFISGTQVNILTPPDAITGMVQVQLTNGTASSSAVSVPAQQSSPSFFVFDATHVTATHVDGSLLGPLNLYPGSSIPAKPNETVILYANGFGPTSVPVVSGSVSQSGTLSPLPVVKIGGLPATVQFAGLVSPGLYQLNVVVPAAAPDGDNALTATYNGSSVQPGVLIAVKK
jgi:uncharacterized protein (TIGR03437 family)